MDRESVRLSVVAILVAILLICVTIVIRAWFTNDIARSCYQLPDVENVPGYYYCPDAA